MCSPWCETAPKRERQRLQVARSTCFPVKLVKSLSEKRVIPLLMLSTVEQLSLTFAERLFALL